MNTESNLDEVAAALERIQEKATPKAAKPKRLSRKERKNRSTGDAEIPNETSFDDFSLN